MQGVTTTIEAQMPRGRPGKMLFFLAEKSSTPDLAAGLFLPISSPLFPYRDINLIVEFLMPKTT
jgi:hypothetical protein